MRRIITILMICVVLIVGATCSANAGEITPRYNAIAGVDSTITSGDGNIAFSVFVRVDTATSLDSAYVDIVLRTTAGETIATYSNQKMTYSYGSFIYANEAVVSSSGTYLITYEVRCYKNGAVVDNPTGSSSKLIYTA